MKNIIVYILVDACMQNKHTERESESVKSLISVDKIVKS
jgi:hypothetical protein